MAKEAYYFSHDFGARNDPKLQKVLMKLGHEGKSVFWDLIEIIYEEGGKLLLSECDNYAFTLRTSEACVKSLISDFGLFENDGIFFWSNSVLNRLEKKNMKKEKAVISAQKKWGGELSKENALKRSERLSIARQKGTHTKEQWEEMLLFFNKQCVKCSAKEKVVKDHIFPIYAGGSDGIDNIQPLCQSCNSSKGPDSYDYRQAFCDINNLKMPAIFLKMPANIQKMPAINERKIKDIKERKEVFKNTLSQYISNFDKNLLNDFYKYWTEPNPSKTKMRFELEKTWDVELRLSNWKKKVNEKIDTKNNNPEMFVITNNKIDHR